MKSKADKFIHYFGEGTVWDLDYGKLLILFLCIYIAIQVSGCAVIGGVAWHKCTLCTIISEEVLRKRKERLHL